MAWCIADVCFTASSCSRQDRLNYGHCSSVLLPLHVQTRLAALHTNLGQV